MTRLLCGSPSSGASARLGVPATVSQGYRGGRDGTGRIKGWMDVNDSLASGSLKPSSAREPVRSCPIGGTQPGVTLSPHEITKMHRTGYKPAPHWDPLLCAPSWDQTLFCMQGWLQLQSIAFFIWMMSFCS